jgi:signal transduction histidine kinase
MANGSPTSGQHERHEPRNGPGLPAHVRASAFRAALVDAVSEDDIQAIAAALVAAARNGNVAAARIVLSYTIGKPFDKGEVQTERPLPETPLLAHVVTPPNCPVSPPTPEPLAAFGGRLSPRARAETRRAERKRLKAERKKASRDQQLRSESQDPRNRIAEAVATTLGHGPISPASSG